MTYSLYLDDERDPKTSTDWTIVRSYDAFVETIEAQGLPSKMSLDHDLGEESKSGYECVKWLVEKCLDEGWSLVDVDVNVHSANPVGATNIRGLVQGFQDFQTP